MRQAAITASLGLLLALAGRGFGSPSLLVCGIALITLAAVAWLWVVLAASGARIERAPAPARIVEGDSYPLRLRLTGGLVPLPGGELDHPLLGAPQLLGPLSSRQFEVQVPMPRRGRHRLDRTTWTIRDPLGLCTRQLTAAPGGELLVLPRIEAVEAAALGVAGVGNGRGGSGDDIAASLREARAVEFEVDGLRPYRDGSPASRIHWPALARSGELYERRMVASARPNPLVVLGAMYPDSEAALDRAVRAAASLCVHLAAGSGCSLLLPGQRTPSALDSKLRSWPKLHAALAVVTAGTPTVVTAIESGRGSIFWVTARESETAPGRAMRAGSGPHYLVSASPIPGRVVFQVAGCTGFELAAARRGRGRRAA